jgi:hypothetical protein
LCDEYCHSLTNLLSHSWKLKPFSTSFHLRILFANVKSLILVYTLPLILSWSWSCFLFPLVPFKAYPGYLAWLSTLDLGVNSYPHIFLIELLLVSMSFHSKVSFDFLYDPCHVPWSKPTQVTWTKKPSTRPLKSSFGDRWSYAHA